LLVSSKSVVGKVLIHFDGAFLQIFFKFLTSFKILLFMVRLVSLEILFILPLFCVFLFASVFSDSLLLHYFLGNKFPLQLLNPCSNFASDFVDLVSLELNVLTERIILKDVENLAVLVFYLLDLLVEVQEYYQVACLSRHCSVHFVQMKLQMAYSLCEDTPRVLLLLPFIVIQEVGQQRKHLLLLVLGLA